MVRWIVLVGVLLVAATAATVSVAVERDRSVELGQDLRAPRLSTPVLSARRVPSITTAPIGDRRLAADLEVWTADQEADTCLQVRDRGGVLFEHRAEEPFVPASAQKLLTATGALLALGPDTTFETVVVGPEPVGGVVDGDLHVVGGGDPLLATTDYAQHFTRQPQIYTDVEVLVDRLVEAGVGEVRGSVVGDESRYDSQRYLPDVWPSRFIADDQTGPLSALSVNDGFGEYPGDAAGSVTVDPHPDPPRLAAEIVTFLLASKGVTVTGEPRSGVAPDGAEPLATLESPPLREVVGHLLRESDNSAAELVLKELGLVEGSAPTSAAGAGALVDVLASHGFETGGVEVADGSGLSSENRLDCDLLGDVLIDPRTGPILVDGLAVAGESGTLERRFTGSPLAGRLRAKTGSLNQVTALAGTLDTQGGERLVFSYVANLAPTRFIDEELLAEQEELAGILHTHPRLADPDAVGPRPVQPVG